MKSLKKGKNEHSIMNVFRSLYLKFSKKRFNKSFQPFIITKKPNHLISVPHNTGDFLKILFFLGGLRNSGKITLLMPKTIEGIYGFLKHNIFEAIFYEKPLLLFSKEYKIIKKHLDKKRFHFLIELNEPANTSLPYITSTERRICLNEKNNFPYYNIVIKDGFNALNEFFNIKKTNPVDLFRFDASRLKKIKKNFLKKRPLLFVNQENDLKWDGYKVIAGKDVSLSENKAYEILYLSDAYYGKHDAFYEFAKIFNKKIIIQ